MAFIILKLKKNEGEPYAIYDLKKFRKWLLRKKKLTVGSALNDKSDITLIRTKTKRRKIGEIIKTETGWYYKLVNKKKKTLKGIFRDGLKITVFDNILEFKEEL